MGLYVTLLLFEASKICLESDKFDSKNPPGNKMIIKTSLKSQSAQALSNREWRDGCGF